MENALKEVELHLYSFFNFIHLREIVIINNKCLYHPMLTTQHKNGLLNYKRLHFLKLPSIDP